MTTPTVKVPPCNRVGCVRADRHTHTGELVAGDRVVVEPVDGRAPQWTHGTPTGTYQATGWDGPLLRHQVDVDGAGVQLATVTTVRLTRVGTFAERQRAARNRELAAHAYGKRPGSSPRRHAVDPQAGVEVALFDTAGAPTVDLVASLTDDRVALWQAIGAQQADSRARGLTGQGADAISSAAVASRLPPEITTRKVALMLKHEVDAGLVVRDRDSAIGRPVWRTTEQGRSLLAALGQ